jgi:transcriptional antiterminator RfaH
MMRWYVMQSKPQKEELVYGQLGIHEIEASYPYVRAKPSAPQTRRRKPYFPGYLFVHVDLEQTGTSALQWIPGAIGLVCFGGEPAWVPDGMLHAIHEHVNQINSADAEALQGLKAGDDIAIHSGPFAGYRGIFSSYLSDRERAMVFLKFIRAQQTRVDLPVSQFSVLKQPRAQL